MSRRDPLVAEAVALVVRLWRRMGGDPCVGRRHRALLWVLDGDGAWRGRLYEVSADGLARYVSPPYWAANGAHFQEVWPNVMPVSRRQIEDFATRGLLGPDL